MDGENKFPICQSSLPPPSLAGDSLTQVFPWVEGAVNRGFPRDHRAVNVRDSSKGGRQLAYWFIDIRAAFDGFSWLTISFSAAGP
jgi:hypothetical protein